MAKEKNNNLLNRYLKGECNASERRLVESWLDKRFASGKWQWKDEKDKLEIKDRMHQAIRKSIIPARTTPINRKRLFGLAASITVFIAFVIFFLPKIEKRLIVHKPVMKTVSPDTKSATLTLEDGSVIKLDEANNGVLAEKGHVSIKKLNKGQLVYETIGLERAEKPSLNKVNIPPGDHYQITLPDGTDVWLNSGSSLSFPSYFAGDSRQVYLVGEAYFEVAEDTRMPFRVKAGDINIKVTGTHFNVSAYENDNRISATLLKGSVEVTKNSNTIMLRPGQQTVSIPKSDYFISQAVDAELSIAWKNGYFAFDDQDIETIMRNVARWYNVEVSFIGETEKGKKVGGTFSRSKSLEDLLQYLEKLEVAKFKKEGRKIIVMI